MTTDRYEDRCMNIPADARVVAGDEDFETARQFVDGLARYCRCVGTEMDGPETLQIPCDALSDGNPGGYATFVTDTYEDPDRHFEGQVKVIFAFTPEETEGKEEDPQSWPWDTAHMEVVPTEEVFPVWSVFDSTFDGQPYEPAYRTRAKAIERAESRWHDLTTEAERRSCVRSDAHRFLVLDPQGYVVRDFGEELDRAIERRHAEEVGDIPGLSTLLTVLADQRGHEWMDSAYALADGWDGDEEVGELMHEYGMDADEAMDMLDALTAIRVIAQKENGEEECE